MVADFAAIDVRHLPAPPRHKRGFPWTSGSPQVSAAQPVTCPRITIVTPSYNQAPFLEATLRSVLLQGYPNLEYIVLDGGSTDGSAAIIRRYAPWLTHWQSQPDGGQAQAINCGLARGSGELFGWLNSDDMLRPNALWQLVALRAKYPTAIGWVGGCDWLDVRGKTLRTVLPRNLQRDQLADWWHTGVFFQPACLFSAEAWRQVKGIDESLYCAFDVDLWLRLAACGDFVSMDAIVAAATIHPAAKTEAHRLRMHAEMTAILLRHGYGELAIARLERYLAKQQWRQQLRRTLRKRLRPIANKLAR